MVSPDDLTNTITIFIFLLTRVRISSLISFGCRWLSVALRFAPLQMQPQAKTAPLLTALAASDCRGFQGKNIGLEKQCHQSLQNV